MRTRDPRGDTRSVVLFLVCHDCGTRGHGTDRFCRRCGKPFLAAMADPEGRPRQSRWGDSRIWRRFVAALAVGLLLLSAGIGVRNGDPSRAQMAGVRIGDPADRVAHVLGKPPKSPQRLLWRPEHSVEMWQYDLDREAGGIPNLSVTFVDGKVWRIAALHGRYATRDGLHVGDTLDKARRLYGTGIEEDAENGLVPWKFVCDGQVVKVIVEQDQTELLAVGLETPQNFRLLAPLPLGGTDDPHHAEPALPSDTLAL